eukprot:1158779-Pelagomonas_calceolata.AAC.6
MDRRSGGPPSSNGSSFQNGNNKRPRDDDEDRFDGMDDVNLDDVEEEMGPPSEDAGEVELGEAGRNWERPKCPDIDPATQSIGVYVFWECERPLTGLTTAEPGSGFEANDS